MDFKSELEEFRKRFKKNREEAKEIRSGYEDEAEEFEEDEAGAGLTWADEVDVPQPGMGMGPDPEEFGEDVDVPEPLSNFDPRFTGNADADNEAFMQYMMNDPVFQKVGPEMEAILEEVIAQASDPENPMTKDEAARVFLEMMEEQFGEQFR